jgi:hypothetical protein
MRTVLVAFLGWVWAASAAAEPVIVRSEPVPLDPSDAGVTAVGPLVYRGGLVLSSEDERFGGLSDLLVGEDGHGLIAISDHGDRLLARLEYDATGRLVGLSDADLAPLPNLDGRRARGKGDGDAEGLARAEDGGYLVSYEQKHRIWHYPPDWGTPVNVLPPRELVLAPRNGGIEALTRLADGRLLALCESFMTQRGTIGWLGDGKAEWSMLTYETVPQFYPTAAAALPNGDVLVLERRYTLLAGASARLVRIGRTAFQPDATIKGDEVVRIAPPLTVDNMEGLALREGRDGKVYLYLLSDDNFSKAQRTLLLMFELKP